MVFPFPEDAVHPALPYQTETREQAAGFRLFFPILTPSR